MPDNVKLFEDDYSILRTMNRLIGTSWVTEVPSGDINSDNKVFIASRKFYSESLMVVVDGSIDFGAIVERDKKITVSSAPTASIYIKYIPTEINK